MDTGTLNQRALAEAHGELETAQQLLGEAKDSAEARAKEARALRKELEEKSKQVISQTEGTQHETRLHRSKLPMLTGKPVCVS